MLREVLHNLVCFLVSLAMLAGAGALSLNHPGWLHGRVQAIVACELARVTGREVQMGKLSGDLITGVEARDVAIAGSKGLRTGVVLSARKVRVSYDLLAVLRGEQAPAAAVKLVEIERPYAKAVRDAERRINLVELFPQPKPPIPVPPEKRFRGRVVIRGAMVEYVDETPIGRNAQGLELTLHNADATIDFGRLDWISIQAATDVTGGQLQSARLNMNIGPNDHLGVDAELAGVDAAWWYDYFVYSPEFQLLGGRADGMVSYWSVPVEEGARQTGYLASAALRDGIGRLTRLGLEPVVFNGVATVTPQGVSISSLDARWAGTHLSATGALFDYQHPTLDLQFQGVSENSRRLTDLLSPESVAQLPEFEGSMRAEISGSLVGPLAHASAELEVALPDDLAVTDPRPR